MSRMKDGVLLRIFIGEADCLESAPIYDLILTMAKKSGLMGATIVRGVASFGQAGDTHTAKLLRIAEDLPLVIEIVDKEDHISKFVTELDNIFAKAKCGGTIALMPVKMKCYADNSTDQLLK
ncbi:MAG: DUF190 domain-containing protein [Nitrospinota bacterium]